MLEDKDKNQRKELSSLGEFGLIDLLTKNAKTRNKSTVMGVGDDAAVLSYGKKSSLVTKDLLIENIHFDLMYVPLKHLGYKAAVVNFSDIVAMNGLPRQLIIGLGISNRFAVEALEEIYEGIYHACDLYGVDLAGGDTVPSKSGLIISVTVIGEADKENIVYRNTAKEGDLIGVTGDLGGAYMGLMVLEREKRIFTENPDIQPDLEGYDYILSRQLKPEARTDIVDLFTNIKFKPTALIDISDGLASEIIHICKGSELGCNLYEDKIPLDTTTVNIASEFNMNPVTCALNGGEDYELLFTFSPEDYEKIKNTHGISVIGHMTGKSEGMNLITTQGRSIQLTAQGWDAFLNKNDD